jgi:hypothetical protein
MHTFIDVLTAVSIPLILIGVVVVALQFKRIAADSISLKAELQKVTEKP